MKNRTTMPTFSSKTIFTVLLHSCLCFNTVSAFHIVSSNNVKPNPILSTRHTQIRWKINDNGRKNNQKCKKDPIQVNSSNDSSSNESDDSQGLIIGSDMSNALQKLGSEGGYLDAARKRNEEAKAKLMEQVRKEEEEAEALRKAKMESGVEDNYGPGGLSSWKGFKDDGFEESEGNDDSGGWGQLKEVESGEGEEEEPKLFLFGDDDDTSGGSGLIL